MTLPTPSMGACACDTYVNVMEQYHPAWKATTEPKYAALNRAVEPEEMEAAFAHARGRALAPGPPLAAHHRLL